MQRSPIAILPRVIDEELESADAARLAALGIPFEYAREPSEVGRQIQEAYTFSQSSLSPVALLLTRDLMEEAL